MRRSRRPHHRPNRTYADHLLGPGPRKRLQRAHHLMENGHHQQAAVIFEQLAQVAYDRKMFNRAPALFMQTGRAYLLAGREDIGANWIWRGLGLLADAGRWPALNRVGNRVTDELEQLGFTELAKEVEDWLQKNIPDYVPKSEHSESRAYQASLPLKCPFCGGVMRVDEIEWLDDRTAECAYCGSAVRGDTPR